MDNSIEITQRNDCVAAMYSLLDPDSIISLVKVESLPKGTRLCGKISPLLLVDISYFLVRRDVPQGLFQCSLVSNSLYQHCLETHRVKGPDV